LALRILEQLELGQMDWGSPEHVTALASVLIEVEDLREKYGFSTEDIDQEWFRETGERIRTFSRGTTHVSVVDSEGNAASMTTSNGEGSGYIVPGTGIMLNNMMGEDDLHPLGFHASPAGQRISSMMSPTIIMKGDLPELVVGSGGSKRIRTAITQVISNIIDFKMEIKQAVEAPRIHWDEDTLQVEPGYSREAIARLEGNWPVNLWQEKNIYFGGAHAVAPGRGGAGDSRRGGNAAESL